MRTPTFTSVTFPRGLRPRTNTPSLTSCWAAPPPSGMLSGSPPEGAPTPTSNVLVITFFLAWAAGAASSRNRVRTAAPIIISRPALTPFMLSLLRVPRSTPAMEDSFPPASAYRFCPVKPRIRARVAGLDDELAVALQRLAVDLDLAALPQVADHVPVDRRLVDAAGLGI